MTSATPMPSTAPIGAEPLTNAVVAQRIEVSPGLIILRVVPRGWELPEFEPGQYCVLALPGQAPRCEGSGDEDVERPPTKLIKRAYSIASSPTVSEYMEFYVALVPSGGLTPRLFALQPGDGVWLSPKAKGLFTLDEVPADKHVVMISTGTGLAPYMSMMRAHLPCGDRRRFAVLHGARHSWDLGYRSELMSMTRLCPNFAYLPTISRPSEEDAGWSGHEGHVQDLWESRNLEQAWGLRPTPENTHVFVCGNPSMIEDMVQRLEAEGYREHSRRDPGQIHVERFW